MQNFKFTVFRCYLSVFLNKTCYKTRLWNYQNQENTKTSFFESFCSEKTTFPVFVGKNWKIGGMRIHGCFVKDMVVECNHKTVQDSQKRFVSWQKQLGSASERLCWQRSCFLSPKCWYLKLGDFAFLSPDPAFSWYNLSEMHS